MGSSIGMIYRINRGGVGFLMDNKGILRSFLFRTIVDKNGKRYAGQEPSELKDFSDQGLDVGVRVKFSLDPNQKVSRVEPVLF